MAVRLSDTEIKSAHGKQLIYWLRDYKYFWGNRVHVVENTEKDVRLRIYTARNCYGIHTHAKPSGDIYLACEASTRAPRPGEDWTRGSDLPDGKFSKALLNKIMGSIVFYEALEIAKHVKDIADGEERTTDPS